PSCTEGANSLCAGRSRRGHRDHRRLLASVRHRWRRPLILQPSNRPPFPAEGVASPHAPEPIIRLQRVANAWSRSSPAASVAALVAPVSMVFLLRQGEPGTCGRATATELRIRLASVPPV